MDQCANMSFELHLSRNNANEHRSDHIERIKHELKLLQNQNQQLKAQLAYIEKNPQQLIQAFKSKLLKRIGQLRQQNQGIQQLIQKSKIPGFAQMTKKKPLYGGTRTPGKESKLQQQPWGQFQRRNPFDSVQMSQKFELSTCQNYPIQPIEENPLRSLEPLQEQEMRARAQLTVELLQVIDRTSDITHQLQEISQQNDTETCNRARQMVGNGRRFQQIAKYKQKLVQLLKKLKIREANQQQIVREYQLIHQQTSRKFREAVELLNQLGETGGNQNLDDLYAEVLQLQQKLKYINEQLERIDETQWLKDIEIELLYALKRLGINPPSEYKNLNGSFTIQTLRKKIDILAQILIQCSASHEGDQKQKLALLKMYYEQQKQNSKRIIKMMQDKEQGLSKKLIDLQMNN